MKRVLHRGVSLQIGVLFERGGSVKFLLISVADEKTFMFEKTRENA